MLEAVSFGLKVQHLWREGKEIFGVETQPHDRHQRRDQEKEDQPADELECIVPQGLRRSVVDRHSGPIVAACQPIGSPAQHRTNQRA